jgi:ParB/RepB/Spo0J family partition protein
VPNRDELASLSTYRAEEALQAGESAEEAVDVSGAPRATLDLSSRHPTAFPVPEHPQMDERTLVELRDMTPNPTIVQISDAFDASNPAHQRVLENMLQEAQRNAPRTFVQTDNGETREVVFGIDFAPVDGADRGARVTMTLDENGVATVQEIEHMPTAAAESNGQLTILPEQRPVPRDMQIPTGMLDVPFNTPNPTPELVHSMQMLGCFSSITVRASGRRFEVFGGRRRAAAARIAGLPMITAIVYPEHTPDHVMAAITMLENNARQPNPLAELEAVETMMERGVSEQEIAAELMIPISLVRRRMGLSRLHTRLRVGLIDGRIFPNVAELAARLTVQQQEALAERLEARQGLIGRARNLRASDVREVRSAGLGTQTTMLDDAETVEVAGTGMMAQFGAMDDEGMAQELIYRDHTFFREDVVESRVVQATMGADDAAPWEVDGRQFAYCNSVDDPNGPPDWFELNTEPGNYDDEDRAVRYVPTPYVQTLLEQAANARQFELMNGHRYTFIHATSTEGLTREGLPPHFILSDEPMEEHVDRRHVDQGLATRYLPESYIDLRVIAALQQRTVEEIDEGQIRYRNQLFMSADRAEAAVRSGVERAVNGAATSDVVMIAGRRFVLEDRAMQMAGDAVSATQADPQVAETYDESWGSVKRLVQRALEHMPVSPDGDSDRMYHLLEDVALAADRMAQGRATVTVTDITGGTVQAGGARPLEPSVEEMARTLFIRPGYREFDHEGDTHYRRYVDTNQRLRRRSMNEQAWRAAVVAAWRVANPAGGR